MGKKEYETMKISGIILGMLIRLSKSLLLNIAVFAFGVAIGLITTMTIAHINAQHNSDYQLIQEIESILDKQRKLDSDIDKKIRLLKINIADDLYQQSKFGKYIIYN